jgi:hypothetical protein
MLIHKGDVFATEFETGCVCMTEPDEFGMFDGLDSDGVLCSYMVSMVVKVWN